MSDEPAAKRQCSTIEFPFVKNPQNVLNSAIRVIEGRQDRYLRWKPEDVVKNPEDPSSVSINADQPLPPGDMVGFIENGKISFKLSAPKTPQAETLFADLDKSFSFDPTDEIGLGKKFCEETDPPRDHKEHARWKRKAAKAGIPDDEFPAWLCTHLHSDNKSDKPSYTRKIIKPDDEGTPVISLNLNFYHTGSGPLAPKIEEDEFAEIPVALGEELRGKDLRPSPFYTIAGKQIGWPEIFRTAVVGNSSIFIKFYGIASMSGVKVGYTGGKGGENYNRVLTIPYMSRRIKVISGFKREREEEEVDEDLLLACQMAEDEVAE